MQDNATVKIETTEFPVLGRIYAVTRNLETLSNMERTNSGRTDKESI